MSSQVVRIQDFSKGSLSAIGNESERGPVNHRNPDINPDLTDNNLLLKTTQQGFYAAWNRMREDLNFQYKDTKKGVAFQGMVITSGPEFFREKFGWEKGDPMNPEMEDFFRKSYAWALDEIGYSKPGSPAGSKDANIISAVVHLDETTPHLQIYFVPVTDTWREKVYAKDAAGHVLRTATGSPIQAKDANGKTIYNTVTDVTAPKLSKTAFWGLKGGKTSFGQMQDSFHEKVGAAFDLGRGEVGSTAKHRTKAQWEQEQLQQQTAKAAGDLQKVQAELKPLQEMKASVEAVDKTGRAILPGVVAIRRKDLNEIQEQAKCYRANRDEVEHLRSRSAALDQREKAATQREQEIQQQQEYLDATQRQLEARYTRQLQLNQICAQAEADRDAARKENSKLQAENQAMRERLRNQEELEQRAAAYKDRAARATQRADEAEKKVRFFQAVINHFPQLSQAWDGLVAKYKEFQRRREIQEEAEHIEDLLKHRNCAGYHPGVTEIRGRIRFRYDGELLSKRELLDVYQEKCRQIGRTPCQDAVDLQRALNRQSRDLER